MDPGDDPREGLKLPHNHRDPLGIMGYGFVAYWRMLWYLTMMFLMLTVMFLPQISILV